MCYVDEIWKKINNDYEISNYGRVRKKNRYIKIYKKNNICVVRLTINSKRKQYSIARLVIEKFVRKLKENEVVCHKNGIILDNRLTNLEIATKKEQGRKTGWKSSRQAVVMLNLDGTIKKIYKGTREASKNLYICRQTVCDYCNKKVKKPAYELFWAKDLI